MIVVSDTSALSALFLIGKLDLLPDLYQKVIVPNAVMDELLELEIGFEHDLTTLKAASWLSTMSIQDKVLFQKYRHILDEGESEALVLMKELNADLLLIDEMAARKVAQAEGISYTGVLGVLLSAKAQGLLFVIQPIMDDLKSLAAFRISEAVYQQVLKEAGEL